VRDDFSEFEGTPQGGVAIRLDALDHAHKFVIEEKLFSRR
jgi:hypothetical protein